ncbi:rod shape-determining protein MreC [Sphingomonas sp. ID0503]|uniref:rod shape-determining protein MreC n=1 Tax=Sphingomonas sp. ID0503 TaxID=3399691 RepID=UPI003AFAFC57
MVAPRADRRPGFSRRAQFGVFAAYVVAITGIIAGLLLAALAAFDPIGFGRLRSAFDDLTTPVSAGLRYGAQGVSGIDDAIAAYVRAGSQNQALREELGRARLKLIEARATAFENRRLRATMRVIEPEVRPVAVARLVSSTTMSDRRIVTITAGYNDGVRPGQPVRAAEGLVGRVLDTGFTAARVLLVTDEASSIPVREVRRGTPGLAAGNGTGGLEIRALGTGAMPFRRGDLLVTSGAGGLYPPGIPVAVVARTTRDVARGWPLARPELLDYGLILPAYRPPLAPPPAPAP